MHTHVSKVHALSTSFFTCSCSFAKHFETKEPLPEEQYQRLKAAKTFRAASMMLRQVRGSHPCASMLDFSICTCVPEVCKRHEAQGPCKRQGTWHGAKRCDEIVVHGWCIVMRQPRPQGFALHVSMSSCSLLLFTVWLSMHIARTQNTK